MLGTLRHCSTSVGRSASFSRTGGIIRGQSVIRRVDRRWSEVSESRPLSRAERRLWKKKLGWKEHKTKLTTKRLKQHDFFSFSELPRFFLCIFRFCSASFVPFYFASFACVAFFLFLSLLHVYLGIGDNLSPRINDFFPCYIKMLNKKLEEEAY